MYIAPCNRLRIILWVPTIWSSVRNLGCNSLGIPLPVAVSPRKYNPLGEKAHLQYSMYDSGTSVGHSVFLLRSSLEWVEAENLEAYTTIYKLLSLLAGLPNGVTSGRGIQDKLANICMGSS